MTAHLIAQNPDTPYQCTVCGNDDVTILRQDPKDPRLKCNACGFVFSGEDSLKAAAAGAIKASSPEALAAAVEPETETYKPTKAVEIAERNYQTDNKGYVQAKVPRTPKYVFMSKDRKQHSFCTERDFKKTVLVWEAKGNYDVFELNSKTVEVNLNLS